MRHRMFAAGPLVVGALALGACGGGSSSNNNSGSTSSAGTTRGSTLAVTVTPGKKAAFKLPKSTKGGLVTITLTNRGQAPHGLQFARVTGGHTTAQALKVLNGQSSRVLAWLHAEGGVSTTAPGRTGTAVVDLPPGRYVVGDLSGPGSGPGPSASLTVAPGKSGALPSTPARIVGAAMGKDHYAWRISGLKAGLNRFTFVSQGHRTLHFVGVVRLIGNPSLAAIKKALEANAPPKFLDPRSFQETAVLDAGRSIVTSLDLAPGRYAVFCPLNDRDGGRPHFTMGMVTKITIA